MTKWQSPYDKATARTCQIGVGIPIVGLGNANGKSLPNKAIRKTKRYNKQLNRSTACKPQLKGRLLAAKPVNKKAAKPVNNKGDKQ